MIPSILLFSAAVIKISSASSLLHSGGLLSHAPLLFFAVFIEIAAAWLIAFSPLYSSWIIAVSIFSVFSIVASYSLLSGLKCNCLGSSTSSWISLALDIGVLALALAARPQFCKSLPTRKTLASAVCLGVLALLLMGAGLKLAGKKDPHSFMIAKELIGENWPIDERFSPKLSELQKGRWMVLIVMEGCEHCEGLIEKYFSDPSTHRAGERTAVFVSGDSIWPFAFNEIAMHPVTSEKITWTKKPPFVASPAVFEIVDGKILSASDGDDSDEHLQRFFPSSN